MYRSKRLLFALGMGGMLLVSLTMPAWAQEAPPAEVPAATGPAPYLAGMYDTGSIAWLLISSALVFFMRSQRERDESYLAEAMDLYDLERRIRQVEARGREATSDAPLRLGLW